MRDERRGKKQAVAVNLKGGGSANDEELRKKIIHRISNVLFSLTLPRVKEIGRSLGVKTFLSINLVLHLNGIPDLLDLIQSL